MRQAGAAETVRRAAVEHQRARPPRRRRGRDRARPRRSHARTLAAACPAPAPGGVAGRGSSCRRGLGWSGCQPRPTHRRPASALHGAPRRQGRRRENGQEPLPILWAQEPSCGSLRHLGVQPSPNFDPSRCVAEIAENPSQAMRQLRRPGALNPAMLPNSQRLNVASSFYSSSCLPSTSTTHRTHTAQLHARILSCLWRSVSDHGSGLAVLLQPTAARLPGGHPPWHGSLSCSPSADHTRPRTDILRDVGVRQQFGRRRLWGGYFGWPLHGVTRRRFRGGLDPTTRPCGSDILARHRARDSRLHRCIGQRRPVAR